MWNRVWTSKKQSKDIIQLEKRNKERSKRNETRRKVFSPHKMKAKRRQEPTQIVPDNKNIWARYCKEKGRRKSKNNAGAEKTHTVNSSVKTGGHKHFSFGEQLREGKEVGEAITM